MYMNRFPNSEQLASRITAVIKFEIIKKNKLLLWTSPVVFNSKSVKSMQYYSLDSLDK